jgi:peptidoglycan/xylan/chitin deacetylase (PgdA/CDA1 family)
VRRLAKDGLARGLCLVGADAWLAAASGSSRAPLVVAYHRVVEDLRAVPAQTLPGMVISRSMLESHLDWLGRHYRIVSLDELGKQLESDLAPRRPLAAVTFDDGYAGIYEHAYPLLKKKGVPAGVFVVTDLVDTDRLHLHDRLYLHLQRLFHREDTSRRVASIRGLGLDLGDGPVPVGDAYASLRWLLERLPYEQLERATLALEVAHGSCPVPDAELRSLSWTMLRTMHASGMTIGSHGRTHAILSREGKDRAREEAALSRAKLELELGSSVRHFAYPDGGFDGTAIAAVAEAGYRFAYTICRHRDVCAPLLTIPRQTFWQGSCLDHRERFSPAVMSCRAKGVFRAASDCDRTHEGAATSLGA